jgi:hypothetical protein
LRERQSPSAATLQGAARWRAVEFLRKVDLESPSRSDPDLFSHHAKRHCAAMVPAGKGFFQKNFDRGSRPVNRGLIAQGAPGRVR